MLIEYFWNPTFALNVLLRLLRHAWIWHAPMRLVKEHLSFSLTVLPSENALKKLHVPLHERIVRQISTCGHFMIKLRRMRIGKIIVHKRQILETGGNVLGSLHVS